MLSVVAPAMVMGMLRSAFAGPCAIITGILVLFAACGCCIKCVRCRLRDCACCKRLLRATGHDEFDDFELMMLVHEALFDRKEAKMTTVIRVTAGLHHVQTDPNSNGIFQQPLHITIEQGVHTVQVELLDSRSRVLAVLSLSALHDVLNGSAGKERVYKMKVKGRGAMNPRIKLTMSVQNADDAEKGFLLGASSDVDNLVRMQLAKARSDGKGEPLSEAEVLKSACTGPLELFEGLGKTTNVFVSVVGPPSSRRWVLGIWNDKKDFEHNRNSEKEIDLLRVQSVQADPTRHHVFVINYFDESRVRQTITFRRIDRARDVWVEILHLLVQKVHDGRQAKKSLHPGHGSTNTSSSPRSSSASRKAPSRHR